MSKTIKSIRPILIAVMILVFMFSWTCEGWAVSSVQKNFRVNTGYLVSGTDFNSVVLAIKKDHSLWDVSRNKKLATGVKQAYSIEKGLLVLKRNGKLLYMYRKPSGSWSTQILLKEVRELPDNPIIWNAESTFVYAVKKNDRMVKGTIKFNTKGSKVTSKKWKTLLSNVSHCYISGEDYGMQDITYYALKKNGKLYAWGYNKHGEVGNGKTKKVKKPTLILKNVKYFTCSYQINGTAAEGGCTAYAIKKNGDLMSWGVNDFLTVQSGLGEKVKKPTKILEDVDWVDGADHVAIAITKDKVLWTWGTAIGVTSVEGNTVMHEGIGLTSVARNVIAADINQFTLYFIDTSNRLKYVGFAPTSAYEKTAEPKKMLSKVKAIYTTDVDGSFALKTDGSLYGWGFAKGGKYLTKPKKLGTGFAK